MAGEIVFCETCREAWQKIGRIYTTHKGKRGEQVGHTKYARFPSYGLKRVKCPDCCDERSDLKRRLFK